MKRRESLKPLLLQQKRRGKHAVEGEGEKGMYEGETKGGKYKKEKQMRRKDKHEEGEG